MKKSLETDLRIAGLLAEGRSPTEAAGQAGVPVRRVYTAKRRLEDQRRAAALLPHIRSATEYVFNGSMTPPQVRLLVFRGLAMEAARLC